MNDSRRRPVAYESPTGFPAGGPESHSRSQSGASRPQQEPTPGPCARRLVAASLAILVAAALPARAQFGAPGIPQEPAQLVKITVAPVAVAAGASAEARVSLAIESSWHINANPPSPAYMIPTELQLEGAFGVRFGSPVYPAARPLRVEFDEQPLAVYDGEVTIRLPLRTSADAVSGEHALAGKLRFQACNDVVCLAPVSVPFEVAVTVTGGAAAPPAAATAPPPTSGSPGTPPGAEEPAIAATPPPEPGFTTSPDAPGRATSSALESSLAGKLASGSWVAFLALFGIGLALNLTPCVYPMIGVTVSIFGARRAAPPLQVFAFAVLYVLGMAVMYSSLGLVAALTGGLFGGLLQSPIVLIGIGLLLVALAFSMFGLYELTLPPVVLSRLGGTSATSAAGVFASGLLVGVFAAPCIGPPIVALLALVGAKGDPWFGFSSFFVLSMGLGAPYLLLGTFSNLIQRLPRSGEWMVWVKKVFGVVLLAVGGFYVLLAVAPSWGGWVLPVALLAGGIYLGFFEKTSEVRAGFRWLKRVGGAAAALAGAVIIATTPTEGIAFETFTPEALEATLQSGTPVLLDFTADWCVPCHELDRFTFTDRRVREAARTFRAFRVDLTRYDSPESERWRKEYGITGVPTVVFLKTDGSEVRAARVEGFLPPTRFLERMRYAEREGLQAAS